MDPPPHLPTHNKTPGGGASKPPVVRQIGGYASPIGRTDAVLTSQVCWSDEEVARRFFSALPPMFDALLPGDRAVTLVVQGWAQRSVRCESARSLKIVFANTGFTMVVDKTKQNKHGEGELYIVAVFCGFFWC